MYPLRPIRAIGPKKNELLVAGVLRSCYEMASFDSRPDSFLKHLESSEICVSADTTDRLEIVLLSSFPICSIDLTEDGKLGYGVTSADELEEIDIGPGDKPRPTFISKKLHPSLRVYSSDSIKTDTVDLSKYRLIIFVRPRHHLFAQVAQVSQVRLQLGSQSFCLLLRTRNKILLLLDALLGGPDFGFKIFQFFLQESKPTGRSRCVDLRVECGLLLVDRLTHLSDDSP
jgi:hypothetical protein